MVGLAVGSGVGDIFSGTNSQIRRNSIGRTGRELVLDMKLLRLRTNSRLQSKLRRFQINKLLQCDCCLTLHDEDMLQYAILTNRKSDRSFLPAALEEFTL